MELQQHLRITRVVENHLRSNHYPPIKPSFVKPCTKAVIACIEGNPETEIDLNEATGYIGEGRYYDIAKHMVKHFRLEIFVSDEIALQESVLYGN